MARIRKNPWVLWAGGLVFVIASLVFGSLRVASAAPPGLQGLPVTANQGTAGSAPWPVSATGTIGVNNFPATQNVSGSIQVDETQPFETDIDDPFTDPSAYSTNATLAVPAGERFIIQTVAVRGQVPVGSKLEATIITDLNVHGLQVEESDIPLTDEGNFTTDEIFSGAQAVTLYADPGSDTVEVVCSSNITPGPSYGCSFAVSGYLVPAT